MGEDSRLGPGPPAAGPPGADLPAARDGFGVDFLGVRVDTPVLDGPLRDDAVTWEGGDAIPYTHFSLALSRSRRLARWVGWNIDGADLLKLSRSDIAFATDPRLPEDVQTGNELYAGNRLDRGHLARRADLLWGGPEEAQRANRDSFRYTNIAPQIDDFNQSSRNGLWGRLEDALFEGVDVENLRASVFGGPVFQDDDRVYRGVQLPREYWKLVVFVEDGALRARAFLLAQDLVQLRALPDLDEFRVYQITVPELEERTRLRFPEALHAADVPAAAISGVPGERQPLADLDDIRW
ncbi:MAG: DNA/RNA non-specific endonuclease [Arthrobacter sp.]|uniref:DNA/RNA non-specific endonuclease n=1 Tax=Arthrobacter sp. TaxID=1667 RepID=UPI0034712423